MNVRVPAPGWVHALRAELDARRPAGRCHRHRLPDPPGDGLRRARRPPRSRRTVGCHWRTRGVRRARVLATAVGGTGVDDRADDGRSARLGTVARDGPGSVGRRPRARRRRVLLPRLDRTARSAGRSAVPTGPRRLPHRDRRHHGRLAAGQAPGHRGQGRWLPLGAGLCDPPSRDADTATLVLGLVTSGRHVARGSAGSPGRRSPWSACWEPLSPRGRSTSRTEASCSWAPSLPGFPAPGLPDVESR